MKTTEHMPTIDQKIEQGLTKRAQTLLTSLTRAASITVDSPEGYSQASHTRSKIEEAVAEIDAGMSPMMTPLQEAKRNIEASLKAQRAFREKLVAPMLTLDTQLKEAMRGFKLKEQAAIEEARQERLRQKLEADRLEREAQAAREKAENAKSSLLRRQLEKQAAQLDQKSERAAVAAEIVGLKPVETATSSTRRVRAWRLSDAAAFLQAMAEHVRVNPNHPLDVISVNSQMITFRIEHGSVSNVPGLEEYTDIQIVRK